MKTDDTGAIMHVPTRLGDVDAIGLVLGRLLECEAVEVFGILCLTARHSLICWHEVARGSLDGVSFQLREVFKAAIMANAAQIVVAHNHPSGEPEPSSVDLTLTADLVDAGMLLGIDVRDHIIVGERRFVSLRSSCPALFPRRR